MTTHTIDRPAAAAVPPQPVVEPRRHGRLSLMLTRRVDVPLEPFVPWLDNAPLESILRPIGGMPGAQSTEPLNAIAFPLPGARRRVHLTDGTTTIEQVLTREPGRSFSYQVWGYTNPRAAGIAYGHGQFWFEPRGAATEVRWRYSFALKPDGFPGRLGALGRLLFRLSFLNGPYRRLMQSTLETIAAEAQSRSRSGTISY